MGWWSEVIIGGDRPLDCRAILLEKMGVPHYEENSSDKVKKALNSSLDSIDHMCYELLERGYDSISYQVIGVMIMESGANFPESLKSKVIKMTKIDEWYREGDEKRVFFIEEFIKQIEEYDGTAVEVATESLYEVFLKKRTEKQDEFIRSRTYINGAEFKDYKAGLTDPEVLLDADDLIEFQKIK
jgi:hypothetical protein